MLHFDSLLRRDTEKKLVKQMVRGAAVWFIYRGNNGQVGVSRNLYSVGVFLNRQVAAQTETTLGAF